MNKPVLRTAIFYATLAGGFIFLDLAIDHLLGNSPPIGFSHLILAGLAVVTSFILLSRALETHRRAESVLSQARDELEGRVRDRTVELEQANEKLEMEIAERGQAEQERLRSIEQVEQARQRAEDLAEGLQLANSILLALIETLPAGMVITDPDGGVVLANAQARVILGSALTGATFRLKGDTHLFRLDGPAFQPEDLPVNRAIQKGETTTGLEGLLHHEDGSQVFVLIAASPVRDETGRVTSAVEIIQDITDLKRMEQALRESEERYRTLFDNFSEPTTVWNKNGELVMQNLISARNLGGKREDYIGKSIYSIFGETGKIYLERMKRVIETGTAENREDVVMLPSGEHYFWTSMQRIQNPAGQYAVQIISYDTTDRKRAEEALRASEEKFAKVFHHSPDAVVIVRVADGTILEVNEAFSKMFGFTRLDVVGKSWMHISLVEMSEEQQKVIEIYQEKGTVADQELNFTAKEGQSITALVSLIPITVGGELCVLAIAHDITLRKQSEKALRQAQAALAQGIQERAAIEERQRLARELHDSVSQVLYGISLGANTALTLFESDRSKVLEALDYILSQARAGLTEMRALIFELRPESLEMEGLVAALNKQTAALRARLGIEVVVDMCDEPEVPFSIKEVVYRITQEALHNAIKHARPNYLEVILQKDNHNLIVEICDDGVGFDPTAAYPGHLGLRSMRERAEKAGGVLEISSAPEQGTRIKASLPI